MKRTLLRAFIMMLALEFLIAGFAFAGQKEKIAVAANGETPAASVSTQAGRAPFFLLFDESGKLIETMANPGKEAGSSGIEVADFLVSKGVTVIVAEGYGGRIVGVMKDKGIRAVAFKGSVEEAVKNVLQVK